MKNTILIFLLLLATVFTACKKGGEVDKSSPEATHDMEKRLQQYQWLWDSIAVGVGTNDYKVFRFPKSTAGAIFTTGEYDTDTGTFRGSVGRPHFLSRGTYYIPGTKTVLPSALNLGADTTMQSAGSTQTIAVYVLNSPRDLYFNSFNNYSDFSQSFPAGTTHYTLQVNGKKLIMNSADGTHEIYYLHNE